jgi:hypothetical protein
MKKVTLLAFCVVVAGLAANAQDFKKFKVGLGLGYALAGGEGAKGGVLVYAEPAYRVKDNFSIGLRLESAIITRGFSEDIGSIDLDVAGIGSYTLNGQYYFNNNSFRPFVGAGFGLYSLAAIEFDVAGQGAQTAVDSGSKFGFYPRVGFDYGHFNMTLDYNLIPASEVEGGDGEFKNSYLGVRIGFSIGGGKN